MKISKKIISISITVVLVTLLFTGCKYPDSFTVATVGKDKISYGLANLYARFTQQTYEGYYGANDDTGAFWDEDSSGSGQTLEETAKDSVINNLRDTFILKQHAKKLKVSLSKKDKKEIEKIAKKVVKTNNKDAKSKFSITKKNVVELLSLLKLQNKMRKEMTKKVDKNVADDDYKLRKFHYISVEFDSNLTTATNASEVKDALEDAKNESEDGETDKKPSEDEAKKKLEEAKAKLISDNVTSDNIEDLAKKLDLEATSQTISKNDATQPEEDVAKKALEMKAGTFEMVKGTDKYYLIYLDSEYDEESSKQKKEEIIGQREDDMYSKKLEKWRKKTKYKLKKFIWNSIDFTKTGIQSPGSEEK